MAELRQIGSTIYDKNCVLPDSKLGKALGFTSKKFDGYLYYNKHINTMYIPIIESLKPHRGNFIKLLQRLHKDYHIVVACPSTRMLSICKEFGMQLRVAEDGSDELYLGHRDKSTLDTITWQNKVLS